MSALWVPGCTAVAELAQLGGCDWDRWLDLGGFAAKMPPPPSPPQYLLPSLQIDDDDLQHSLAAAVTCTILAAAGPQRSRMLATLYKDERCAKLPVFPFLEKVYMERMLQKAEVRP